MTPTAALTATELKTNVLLTIMASEQTQTSSTARVAAVQAEGCYFDLPSAVKKTCRFVEGAFTRDAT